MAHARDGATNLQYGRFVLFRIGDFKYDVVQISPLDPGTGLFGRREVARDRGIRSEKIIVVRTVVVGILLFFFQNSDDEVGNALYKNGRADGGLSRKELTVGF